VAAGRLGDIRHVRAVYLQDWITDPQFPLVWRLQRERAGSGALGDIGAHIVDLAQFVTGSPITGVSGLTETFVKQRPLPEASSGLSATGGESLGEVTVDDAALFLARFGNGALATFEATRFAAGRKNAMRIEVNGSKGSLAFDFESMNELSFYDHTEDGESAGFRRVLVTEPGHPYLEAWWPPATSSATSTPSPTRCTTSSRRSAAGRTRRRRSPTVAGAARARGGRAQRRRPQLLDLHRQRREDGAPMTRPVTLFTGQWADLPFEEMCRLASEWGYDGLELACWGDHFEVDKASRDDGYVDRVRETSPKSRPQGVDDLQPPGGPGRLRRPDRRAGTRASCRRGSGATGPEGVRQRAGRRDGRHGQGAAKLGVRTVVGLHRLEDLEDRGDVPAGAADDGRRRLPGLRRPLEPDPRRLRRGRRALRPRGAPERDRVRLLDDRSARWRRSGTARPSGSNWDPSHFVWQDLDPVGFLWDFRDRIYHVDCKDAKRQVGNGRNGRMGSHLAWADPRRGWDFVSTGHGDVPWEACFRMLNTIGYDGPISVEWEDAGMDRLVGRPRRWSSSGGWPSTRRRRPSTRRSARGTSPRLTRVRLNRRRGPEVPPEVSAAMARGERVSSARRPAAR
jgi:hypothetical protein